MIKKIKEIWNSHVEMLRIQKDLKEANKKLEKLQTQQKEKNFSDYKETIFKVLNETDHGIQEPTSLVNGFINQPVFNKVTGDIIIGGRNIPMVAVVGKNSGRVYFFAFEALLSNLDTK